MFIKEGIAFEEDWARSVAIHTDLVAIKSTRFGGDPSPVEGALATYGLYVPSPRPTRVFAPFRQRLWVDRTISLLHQIQRRHGTLDFLHGHFYPVGGLLDRLRMAHGFPYVLTEHSSRLTRRSTDQKPLSQNGIRIADRGYRGAETVFFPSEYLRACVERLGLSGRFTVVGNPVATQYFFPRPGLTHSNRILWVGRLESDKDPISALRGFEAAKRQIEDLRLDIVGAGPDRRLIEDWIRDKNLGNAITVWGRQPRHVIADLLSNSALFLSSSVVETFGIAVAEALASGVPVVAPDIPPMRELVGRSDGILYSSGDVSDMRRALVQISSNPEWFSPREIAKHIQDRFTFDAVGSRVAEAYARLLTESRVA